MTTSAIAQGAQAPAPGAQPASQAPSSTTSGFPTFEVTGGYQVLHVPDQTFPFGLNVDGAWNYNKALGLVGELGWAFKTIDENEAGIAVDGHTNFWHFGVGPRWSARGGQKFWPFAQILAGAAHIRSSVEIAGVDNSFSDTKFMLQPGVGVNIHAGDGWGWVGQVDYRRVFLDEDEDGDSGENEFRVFVGVRLLLD